ncbi:excisionase family DNA-binding protein [Kineococcus sp. T13]|uniref:excisionase family DNA-binding protein n=1 Tax=Kineococcus vitellinus TaxID=2696565 RepID=UPI001411B39D|nr:excisionase family DNA-binding protein [Kineococcus vitellinus]NAZ73832.1 excisionase family DNA-binding protein [Kineococcus vitellinus]
MSKGEAAVYMGVPPRFIDRLVYQRRVAFVKVGKYVRFRPEVLDQWIEDNTIDPDEDDDT